MLFAVVLSCTTTVVVQQYVRPFNCRFFRNLSPSHSAHAPSYMEEPHRGSGQSSQFKSRPFSTLSALLFGHLYTYEVSS